MLVGGETGLVGAAALAVALDGAIVRLHVDVLGVLVGALKRPRQVGPGWHDEPPTIS
jgi:hypothetical protein